MTEQVSEARFTLHNLKREVATNLDIVNTLKAEISQTLGSQVSRL